METLTIMPTTILEHIKACDLPAFLTKKLKVNPDTPLKITIEIEEDDTGDGLWPPEEHFRPEFIEAVEQSGKNMKAGRVSRPETIEELRASMKKIWDE